MKVLRVALILLVVALLGSGCFLNQEKEKAAIDEIVTAWVKAVEDYDVDGMVDPLADTFKLEQRTNGVKSGEKDLAKLLSELNANEAAQLQMRQKGYSIELDLVYSVEFDSGFLISDNKAEVVGTFSTDEAIPGLFIEESGTIKLTLVQTKKEWYVQEMVIDFVTN